MEPNTNPTPVEQGEAKGSTGIITSVIVIVLVLGFGAYYFLKQVPATTETPTTGTTTTDASKTAVDPTVSALSTQGTSTNINDIQKDLNATDLSNVGSGVSNVSL